MEGTKGMEGTEGMEGIEETKGKQEAGLRDTRLVFAKLKLF